MAEYNDWKKAWDWLNSQGCEFEDDGLLDVEPIHISNMGELADLMIEYSEFVNNSKE